ncbi:hypothetical protein LSTR_LSTR011500 [Laodelphax striatellus]|uniref:Uncharacterized protein n=1 Tax=Laodelphax striatellus TaxID=195883 RepID=A0A482WFI9_LAOST|nr:hypothetical protein LSTR_LSTR011500 [Laodelphax striatellus]
MEDESNNAVDEPIENSIIDSIAEIMEELPLENEQIPNPSTPEGYVFHEGALYPKPSTMRMLERAGKLPPNLSPELFAFMHLDDKDLDILLQSDSPISILQQLYEEGFEEITDDEEATNGNAIVGEEPAVADVGQLSDKGFEETAGNAEATDDNVTVGQEHAVAEVGQLSSEKGFEETTDNAEATDNNATLGEEPAVAEVGQLSEEGIEETTAVGEQGQDADLEMNNVLEKENPSELERLRGEGLLPNQPPPNTEDTDENSNRSEDLQTENRFGYMSDPELLPQEKFNFGYKNDCFKLLTRFSASKDQSFINFTEEWKKMKFYAVFRQHWTLNYDDLAKMYGGEELEKERAEERARYDEEWTEEERLNHEEALRIIQEEDEEEWRHQYILESVPELFLIPKIFMLPEYPKVFNRGAFYMLYALYYRQEFKTDDTLTTGEFTISFDLTEFCRFKQICDGETEQGKHELHYMFHKLMKDGGINFKTTFNDHNDMDIGELETWYYYRLWELKEGIKVSVEWDEMYKAYKRMFEEGSDIKLRESLWDLILNMKNDDAIIKVKHSPIPKTDFYDGDDDNDGDSANDGDGTNDGNANNGDCGNNDGGYKTIPEYLSEFPETLPEPEPESDDSSPPTPNLEVDLLSSPSTSEQRISLFEPPVDEIPKEISDSDSKVICVDETDKTSPSTKGSTSKQSTEEISESEVICLDDPDDSSPSTPNMEAYLESLCSSRLPYSDMEVDAPTSPSTSEQGISSSNVDEIPAAIPDSEPPNNRLDDSPRPIVETSVMEEDPSSVMEEDPPIVLFSSSPSP